MEEKTDKSNNLNNPHDRFFKAVFSILSIVRGCLLHFLPKDLLEKLDLDTLEVDPTSYITEELIEFYSDLVWRCKFKQGYQQTETGFIFEHKSYKPTHPHFQLWDYKRGAWRTQLLAKQNLITMLPIMLYHGQENWDIESFDSYFGKVEPEMLRFISCFDYILINLLKYSDEDIKKLQPILLQKVLLAFKHASDTDYIKRNIVELWLMGYENSKDEQTASFIRTFGIYLAAISGVTRKEILGQLTLFNNNLNLNAMTFIDEFIEEGIEKGLLKGIEKGKKIAIYEAWKRGNSFSLLANVFGMSVTAIQQVVEEMKIEIDKMPPKKKV
jgi:predicted transposase/invertase (TIGR01784 family)